MNDSGLSAKRRRIGFWACAALLCLAVQSSAEEVLKLRVTSSALGGVTRCYRKISFATRTLQYGDYVEYDIFTNNDIPGIGGIDIRNTDGVYWRSVPGWQDQNGLSGSPTEDLSGVAYGRWYHRKLAVPPSIVGKQISYWDVAVDGDYGPDVTVSAQYDNIVITNNASVVLTVYQSAQHACNANDIYVGVGGYNLFSGPMHRSWNQTCAYLFYWYNAPDGNASPSAMAYHPYGLVGDPYSGYGGGYYSDMNEYWWEGEFQDMKRAGIDIAAPVCWGDHSWEWFRIAPMAAHMVPVLERSGCDIKIALFDDTTSETSEWNVDNGRGYVTSPKMPLSNWDNWIYFYDRKIKPFFAAIPQKHWATHNGLSVDQGGRPLIIAYSSHFYADVEGNAMSLWDWVKNRFAADFKNLSGNGIVPWVILETSWGSISTADGSYSWGAALSGAKIREHNGYRTGAIGPGFDERIIKPGGRVTPRLDGGQMTQWFNGTSPPIFETNLIMVETWNELWEATGIDRCKDYPADAGGYLPETQYIDIFRNLIRGSTGFRELDATFLRTWNIPASVNRGQAVDVIVRNDGFLTWDINEIALGGQLLDSGTREPIPGTGRRLAAVPQEVLSGQECVIRFYVPPDWPEGDHLISLDMVRGAIGFSTQGDLPVVKAISIATSIASVDMGDTDVPNLLSRVVVSDGDTTATTVDGLECRKPVNTGDRYFYFAVGDSFLYNTNTTTYLEVAYFDDRPSSDYLRPEYDSNYTTDSYGTGGIHYRAAKVNFSNTGKWKVATWTLDQCKFANRQGGGADFRIYVGASGSVKIDSVRVSKVPWSQVTNVERDLGVSEIYRGLSHPQPVEGQTVVVTQNGRSCRRCSTSGDNFLYFNVSDAIIYSGSPSTVYLRAAYLDSPGGFIEPQYDSTTNAYTSAARLNFTGTNTWKLAVWKLTNARFGNNQVGSADLGLYVGNSQNVYIDEVMVSETPIPDGNPASIPATVQAVALTPSSIRVSWTASTAGLGVAGYRVFRDGNQIAVTTSMEYTDNGLCSATTYSYTVSAFDWTNGESPQSSPPALATTYAAVNIGEAMMLADGFPVGMVSKNVSAVFADHFYIEEHDRSAGIKVVPAAMPAGLAAGKTVDIGGVMRTESGERYIEAGAVIVI